MKKSLLFTLDSYKQLHHLMLPKETEYVYSYFEARVGAMYDYTVFFGLQSIIKEWLIGEVITKEMIDEAEPILKEHFKFNGDVWSREKWDYIIEKHGGKLPVIIKAVKEGTKVPISNALFTIVNTDPKCAWLTNALETLLQQVWYGTTVATRSNYIVNIIRKYFNETVDDDSKWLIDYGLHDFGQRAASCMEQAGIGGAAHLINSKGTDSDMGIFHAIEYYHANIDGLAYSVPASEHACATALGREGEFEVTKNLIKTFPNGILSVVSDSYNIENAVKMYRTELKDLILGRNGKFVIRPDSPRWEGDTPEDQVLWIAQELDKAFGSIINTKGYKVLDSHTGIIYGDSLTEHDIRNILEKLKVNGFAATTCVYGCGGYLISKLNRDTNRHALKSSAQCRDGVWHNIFKKPSDISKASKTGRLILVRDGKEWDTIPLELCYGRKDELETVFENGELIRDQTFDEIRKLASE
jgi:nicotinamide phosphoribosyltransferase